jgi:hypothetical protein
MARFGGRSSRGGPRRPARSGRSSYTKTRRGGRRSSKPNNLGRLGIGLGIAAGGLLAINAGIHGLAGTSHSIKTLTGDFKAIRKWATTRKASKATLAASTVAFHAKRVTRLQVARKTMTKFRSGIKTKFKVRRFGKR